jgi:hypothetical protein
MRRRHEGSRLRSSLRTLKLTWRLPTGYEIKACAIPRVAFGGKTATAREAPPGTGYLLGGSASQHAVQPDNALQLGAAVHASLFKLRSG